MAFFPAALIALYLAVLFQTFAEPQRPDLRGSPFRSGLRFPDETANTWKSAALVVGVQVALFLGLAVSLTAFSEALAVGAFTFLLVLVGMPQMLWALVIARPTWAMKNQAAVLNGAFLVPPIAACVVGLIVGVI